MENETSSMFIAKLGLEPHPEGGFYKQIYKSSENLKIKNRTGMRASATIIYYLLEGEDFSAWHSLKSDEIWHYCAGSSLTIHVITQTGELLHLYLGNPLIDPRTEFQVIVKKDQWFSASVDDIRNFSLVTCTVSPGFDFRDFKFSAHNQLMEEYPQHADIIRKFLPDDVRYRALRKNNFISDTQKNNCGMGDNYEKNNKISNSKNFP